MTSSDPPEVVELFDRIAKLAPRAIPFEGTILRSAGIPYANEQDLFSGAGASAFGARWNRKGIRAVYGSLEIETAVQEAYQEFLSYGLPLSGIRPRVLAGANTKLSAVFDLTSLAIRRNIGFTLQELLEEDWKGIQAAGEESWSQAIGRGCRAAGLEALLVPSARRRHGKNLVIFPDQLVLGSVLEPIAPHELPSHPSNPTA